VTQEADGKLSLQASMEEAWNAVQNRLFCESSKLVYDFVSSLDEKLRFEHLPYPEEIARQLPNPCGWGTGMEDSMLNAGSVMEILRLKAESGAGLAPLKSFASKIFRGMISCATVHGKKGFVARSVSHRDGKSCYINSSRDQFTLFVYGVWRYLRSELPSEEEKALAAGILEDVAAYCERSVRPETGANLLRLDGRPALVSKMLDVEAHEALRLPMFYAAAWSATGNPRWRELYLKLLPECLAQTLAIDTKRYWWNIALVQLQVSLALILETETDAAIASKLREAMRITSELAEAHFDKEEKRFLDFAGSWQALGHPWSGCKMILRDETLSPGRPALHEGYAYFMPQEPESYLTPFSLLRAIGNLSVAVLLCQDREPDASFPARLSKMAATPDYRVHASGASVNILHGYWLAKARNLVP